MNTPFTPFAPSALNAERRSLRSSPSTSTLRSPPPKPSARSDLPPVPPIPFHLRPQPQPLLHRQAHVKTRRRERRQVSDFRPPPKAVVHAFQLELISLKAAQQRESLVYGGLRFDA
ncbi:hypothetical protein C8Q77DRAFT_1159331 [Trametes polyzona]|nr:hypothetical protein C8Q77DRAFT_1159331 [Trametes polyzona]